MKSVQAFATLSVFLCLLGAPTNADELRLTASEWRPYVDTESPKLGFAVYLVSEALERAGYESSIEAGAWPKALEDTIAGEKDVFATLWRTDERAESIVFSEPYINNEMVFVRLSGSGVFVRNRADLEGLRIGIVDDFAYAANADTSGIEIVSSGSVTENIERLRNGELDLVLADRRVALTEINERALAKLFDVLPQPLITRGLRIGVSKQREDAAAIVKAFDEEIAKMREDGSYNAILATFRVSDW